MPSTSFVNSVDPAGRGAYISAGALCHFQGHDGGRKASHLVNTDIVQVSHTSLRSGLLVNELARGMFFAFSSGFWVGAADLSLKSCGKPAWTRLAPECFQPES